MNVLLVYHPLNYYTSYWHPHLGLGYIAAILDNAGHEVKVLDCVAEKMGFEEFRKFFERERRKFDVVGTTATTYEIGNAHKIASIVKDVNRSVTTIVGGPHCSVIPKQTLEEFPNFDIVVIGEGENNAVGILDSIEGKKNKNKVKGIAYRNDGKIILTEPMGFVENLNKIPFPAWDKFLIKRYRSQLGIRKRAEVPILTGRGCPHQCVFCQRFSGTKVRLRDVKNVVDEIEHDVSLGVESLMFCDETFTLLKKRTLDICDEIIKRGLHKKIQWHCETRVNTIDMDILKKLKEANCVMVNYGVESGNDFILKKVKKGINIDLVRRAFAMTRKAGLRSYMNLIFGHPYETEETINDSINLMMEVNPDFVTIGIMTPFPGTEILEMAKRNEGGLKLLNKDWDNYAKQNSSVLSVNNLTNEDLKRYQSKAYSKFYFRPSRILNMLELVSIKGMMRMGIDRLSSSKNA